MCLCRNSCLPKGLTNWTLIYNLPLETNLEGDSSCLQLPVVQEAKPLLHWSCLQWRSQAQGTPALEDWFLWHMLQGNIATWILHGKMDGHVTLSVPMDCFYMTGYQTAPCSEIATMGSAPKPGPSGTVAQSCHWCREELYVCGALCPCCGFERN